MPSNIWVDWLTRRTRPLRRTLARRQRSRFVPAVEVLEDRWTPSADLSVTKTGPATVTAGGTSAAYTVTVTNNGPAAATNVALTDTIPAGASFGGFDVFNSTFDSGSGNPPGGPISATKANLAAGASAKVVYTLVIGASTADGSMLTGTASVTSDLADGNLDNNSADFTSTVATSADLRITSVTDTPDPVTAGNSLTYTINFSNAGPSNAQTVTVSDQLPAGATLVSVTTPAGWTRTDAVAVGGNGTLTFARTTAASGETAAFTIVVGVPAATAEGATVTNTATVSSTTPDPSDGNNSATATTTVQRQVDLQVAVTDSPDPVTAGSGAGNLVYTVTVTNAGPSDATGVALDVSNVLPAGVTFVSAAGDGTNDLDGAGTDTWTVGPLAAGATATLTVTYTVGASAAAGTAAVSLTAGNPSTAETLVSTGDDSDTEATTIQRLVDLSLTKVGPPLVTAGSGPGNVVYVVTVTNNGPSDASGVTVAETTTLPPGVTVDSVVGSGSTVFSGADGTGVWTIGTLSAGASATLTLTLTVGPNAPATVEFPPPPGTPGDLSDIATVSTAAETDTVATNDTAALRTPIARVFDVGVITVATPNPVLPGGTVTYTMTVTNSGPSAATGVAVSHTFPAGLTGVTLVSVVSDGGAITAAAPGPVAGSFADSASLAPGASLVYTFTATVLGSAAGSALAATSTAAAPESIGAADANLANNTATATVEVSVVFRPVGSSAFPQFTTSGDQVGVTVRQPGGSATEVAGSAPGSRAVVADVTGDGVPDTIVATGPGGRVTITLFDGATGAVIRTLGAFEDTFRDSATLAAADVNGDGIADIAVGADAFGGPRVTVFDGATGAVLADFYGIDDPDFRGGVRVALGDFNGDGLADLAVAAGVGGGPRIAVWNGTSLRPGVTPTRLVDDFFCFEPTLRDGANVALGDVNGDGKADLILSGGPGGGPRVLVWDAADFLATNGATRTVLANFFAGDPTLSGGGRVAAKNLDGDSLADLVVGIPTGPNTSVVRTYLGKDLTPAGNPPLLEEIPLDAGGVFVG